MDQQRDEKLWQIAVKRAKFRKSAYMYLFVNALLWAIWWFTTGSKHGISSNPWPLWVMLGWGIGLTFQYYEAYHGSKSDMAEREYEKLKNRL